MLNDKMKNLLIRTASGIVLLVVVVSAVFVSPYTFAALLLLIGLWSMYEFIRLAETGREVKIVKWLPMTVGAALILFPIAWYADYAGVAEGLMSVWIVATAVLVLALTPLCFVVELFRRQPHPMENAAVEMAAVVYAAVPMMLFGIMALSPVTSATGYDPKFVMTYILIVWVNDIFAYLTGMSIGRHKMFERISPKKTWEGLAGGVVFAIGFAMAAGWYFGQNVWIWGGFGAVTVAGAILGDLVESMFKREVGVKDSGKILPGHGGMMDRFDALLLSLPWAFIYFMVVMNR